MSQSILWVAIIISTVFACFLLTYSIKMWRKINMLKQTQTQIHDAQIQKSHTTQLKAIDSVKLIAQFMMDEQVELSEGCIRIKILLDHINPDLHEHPDFHIFSTIYTATEHMPTHEARKKADKKLIRKLDKERLQLEADYRDKILLAAQKLVSETLH